MKINIYGDTSKPKMLAIHPMLADGESMMQIMNYFLDRYCVIAPDLTGQGKDTGDFISAAYEAEKLVEYLILHEYTEIELLLAASLGAAVSFEIMEYKEIHIKTAVMEGAPMFEKIPTIITKLIATMFLKKQKKAKSHPGSAEKRMTDIYGETFGPSMGKSFETMSKESLKNIVKACSSCCYPNLTKEQQKRLFFEYGSKDKDSTQCNTIKKHYPYATITLREGYGHCRYMSTHYKEYGKLLEDYMNRCNC